VSKREREREGERERMIFAASLAARITTGNPDNFKSRIITQPQFVNPFTLPFLGMETGSNRDHRIS